MSYPVKPLPPVDLPELRQVGKPLRKVDAMGKAVGTTVYAGDFSMPRMLPDRRIEVVHILFPDPWWKEQHRVKRLFSPPFVDLLAGRGMRLAAAPRACALRPPSGGFLLLHDNDVGEQEESDQ